MDKDGTVEIVTVGCMYISALFDPDLRIWSIQQGVASIPVALLVGLAIVGVITIVIVFLFVKKKRK